MADEQKNEYGLVDVEELDVDESLSYFLKTHKNFWALLIFGNIENLVLSSQGAANGVDPIGLGILTLIAVIAWLLIGTYGTKVALKYESVISFIGGFAIFILGIQSMLGALGIPL